MTNRVRETFRAQAKHCRDLGSPFNGQLCALIAERLDENSPVGARVLNWPGNPDPTHDALALRLAGALHALALSGKSLALAALYPPHPAPPPDAMWRTLASVLNEHATEILAWLQSPPQTNEVGRSSVLMSGLLAIAAKTKLPISLYEIGASAGLNLVLDRYAFTLGGVQAGDPNSPLRLTPKWSGNPPPRADVKVVQRRGVDLSPLDITSGVNRQRMLAYIWPDQTERLARMRHAISIATIDPPTLDKGDAADWVERHIATEAEPGCTRVLMHSVTFQYLAKDGQDRIVAHLEHVGAQSRQDAPFCWLRMEMMPSGFGLQLTTWPDKQERILAHVQAHGAEITWL
jgi:hypothetical protein